jgi:fucose permease
VAALALPALAAAGGSEAAFLFVAALCAGGALAGEVVLRGHEDTEPDGIEASTISRTLRDGRLWRLSLGSGLYLYAQVAVIGFGVLFLHDEHDLSATSAAFVVAAAQVLAVGLRIGVGRWSDLIGKRVRPLRQTVLAGIGVAAPVLFAIVVSGLSWPAAFAVAALFLLAGVVALRPLGD